MSQADKKRERVLGVDLGLKRTGLAVSDELWLTTRALPNLSPKSRAEDIAVLLELSAELEVGVVVIGYPLMPESEQEGPMARRARGFAEALRLTAAQSGQALEVALQDERLSSKSAAKRLAESGMAQKKRRQELDSEAARILIEEYIASHS